MGSSMMKTTLREIRQSLGRYLAIMAIVALGVGLFCGLKVTRDVMVKSAQQYFEERQLYDISLLSTVGFDTDVAKQLSRREKVLDAQGAVSTDALLLDAQGKESALKVYSLLDQQNLPVLVSGRLPQNAQECVVDAQAFGKDAVGTMLTLSENNEEDTEELFAHKQFHVVGTVNSPYYANYERGTTSLGNGTIRGFMLVLKDAFDCDYDTEIFVRLNTEGAAIYSEEYDAQIDEVESWLEDFAQQKADERYQRLKADGEEELYASRQQLLSQTQKNQLELEASRQQLSRAEGTIADGKAQLEIGKTQLISGKAQLQAQRQQLLQQQAQLQAQRQQILQGLNQARTAKSQTAGNAYLAQANAQAQAQEQQLQASLTQVEDGLRQVESGLDQLELAQSELELQEQQLQASLTQVEDGLRQVESGLDQLELAQSELELQEQQLQNSQTELEAAQREYDAGLLQYKEGSRRLSEGVDEANQQLDEAQDELDELEEPDVYLLGRDTNIGYASFDNDSSIVNGIANVFPIFFFLVAALVCVTTMNRMVEEQRTQIGVLKALGYSEGSIMGKYLFYSGSAAGLGCLIGFFGGSILFPYVIWQAYAIMYRMGGICFVFDLRLGLVSLAASMLCSMGTTYLSCRYELMSVPAQLMRPKAPKAGKRILLERITFVWNRLSFLVKVSIRNVLRYKKRFCMMVIGISGCTALLVTGFGVKDSIANIAGQQFGSVQTYGMSLLMQENYSQGEWEELEDYLREEGRGYTRASERSMDLDLADGKTKSVTVVIPEDTARFGDYWDLHTESGEPIPFPKQGEAILTAEFARRQGIKEGDTVSLSDEDGNRLTLRIIGLSENYVYNYLYLTADSWESQNGEAPDCRSVYINTEGVSDEHRLLARLMKLDAVSSVTVNQDTLDRFDSMMSSLDYIVLVIIICAGSLAFIVLYNLTNINITERIREIATIKVLGFYPMETAAYVFRENLFLTAIGGSAGLLLGKLLHWFVMEQINIDMVSFPHTVLPLSYGYSLLLTFLFAFIVNLVMFQKLDKINMAESLKSIE